MMQSAKLTIGDYDSIYAYMPKTKKINDTVKDWDLTNLCDYSTPPPINLRFNNDYWQDLNEPPFRMVQYLGNSIGELDVISRV